MIQKVLALQDDYCHWYVIPETLHPKWIELTEQMESDNANWFEKAQDEFIDTFSKYMTGGDLNSIQLYAELDEQPLDQ